DYERVKSSILEHGLFEPIELTPADAEEYPSTVADGYLRLAIADELGMERVPVRVVDHLRTYADQAIYALAKTQRKELTEGQRASAQCSERGGSGAAPLGTSPAWPRWSATDG